MKRKTLTTFTLPATLAGIVLGCLPSVAHAHGNNPKKLINHTGREDDRRRRFVPDVFGSPPDTQMAQGPEGDAFGPLAKEPIDSLSPQLLLINDLPSDFDVPMMMGHGLPAMHASVETSGPVDFGDDAGNLGRGSSIGVPTIPGGAIPSPGALGLLGLAALTVGRRRRRG